MSTVATKPPEPATSSASSAPPSRAQIRDAELQRRMETTERNAPKERRPFHQALFWSRAKFWLWTITTKLIVFIMCEELMTEGVINLAALMGKKLWKVPGLWWLEYIEITHRLTLANLFVVIPVICTFMLWSRVFRLTLAWDRFAERYKRYDARGVKRVYLILAVIVICADAGIFFASFGSGSWGGHKWGPTTVLATAMYVATVAFVSLISVFLSDDVTFSKEKEKVPQ